MRRNIRQVYVVRDKKLLGVITIQDLRDVFAMLLVQQGGEDRHPG